MGEGLGVRVWEFYEKGGVLYTYILLLLLDLVTGLSFGQI